MGKRSNFERNPRDYYPTPLEAVRPLIRGIDHRSTARSPTFIEPCAGDGRLTDYLESEGMVCVQEFDIEPQKEHILKIDALKAPFSEADYIITNPPWDRKILHPMIDRFRRYAPTWLLFDADWMHTKQAIPYLEYCSKIVSVGRVKWIEGSKTTGKDNCAWYCFEKHRCETVFVGRLAD